MRAKLRVGWPALLLFNLLVLPLSLQGIHSADTDTFYHLAGGRYMVEHGRLLDREVFSFTLPGEPWTNYYWLFQYVLFRLYQLGGLKALIAFRAAVVILTLNLAFWTIHRRSGGTRLVTLAFSLAVLGIYLPRAMNIRPHLISYLFLVIAAILLERFRRRTESFEPWLPILCVFWANLHGVEYPILLASVGIYAVGAVIPHFGRRVTEVWRNVEVRRWLLLFGLCAAAFVVNPFGTKLFAAPLIALDDEVMRYIAEMQPRDWTTLFALFPRLDLDAGVVFNYAVIAALVAAPGWASRRDARAILFLLFGLTLALRRVRFMPEYALLVLPWAAEAFARIGRHPTQWARVVRVGLAAFVGYMGVAGAATAWARFERGHFAVLSSTAYPIGPVGFIQRESLRGNMLCEPAIAGYVEWLLSPAIKIAMDMRTPEPFNRQTYWRVRVAEEGVPQLRLFERQWPVDFMLLYRQSSLAAALAAQRDGEFVLTYADGRFVLFAHRRVLEGERARLALTLLDPFDTGLGYIEALRGKPELSRLGSEARRLIEYWPRNQLAQRTELVVQLTSGQAEAAYAKAVALMAQFSREATYPYYAGLALSAVKQEAAALAMFEKAIRLDPEFTPTYPALAAAAIQTAWHRRGLDVMEEYLRRRNYRLAGPEYLLLGDLRYRAGETTAAAEAYERALWLTPEDSGIRADVENNLGGAYVDLGQAERALALLEAALRRGRPFAEAEFNQARAWAKLGRHEAALAAFLRLAEDPSVPAPVRSGALAQLREPRPP